MRLFILIIICGFANYTFSQVEISGNVRDKDSGNTLYPATVYITQNDRIKAGTITDEQGNFRLDGVNSGNYMLHVDFLGYHSIKLPVVVGNADNTDYQFLMEVNEYFYSGTPIEITENPYKSGDLTMTQQQYKIMPASFQDPSRVLLRYPGFSTENDGANNIVFRGMPPDYARWQLYGVDIVNPNHLSNAGTATDQATANAGGVNALSGSILDYYHFEANPADISYANVLSGVSDMKMSPRIRSFVDINFIGLESGLNFSNKKKDSRFFKNVYAAYRYSFTGLLSNLGVDFGNEKIGYQDLALNAEIYQDNHRSIRVFGVLGKSSNVFKAVSNVIDVKRFKDVLNIDFKNNLAVGGIQHRYHRGKVSLSNTVAISTRNTDRTEMETRLLKFPSEKSYLFVRRRLEYIISAHNYTVIESKSGEIKLGIRSNYKYDRAEFEYNYNELNVRNEYDQAMIYPYVSYLKRLNQNWRFNLGLATTVVLDSNTKNNHSFVQDIPEPFTKINYAFSQESGLELAYRRSRARENNEIFVEEFLQKRDDIRSDNIQLNYSIIRNDFQFMVSAFIHRFSGFNSYDFYSDAHGVAELGHIHDFNGELGGYPYWYTNVLYGSNVRTLHYTESSARVRGVESKLWRNLSWQNKSLSFNVNASYFNSQYQDRNKYFDSKFDFRYIYNAMISYSFNIKNVFKDKRWMFSAAWHHRGGLREPEFTDSGFRFGYPIYKPNHPLSNRFAPYKRLDVRLVYSLFETGSRYTHRWSLDIQNILNYQNEAFRYGDHIQRGIITQPQLGLVPVLSYRLEW